MKIEKKWKKYHKLLIIPLMAIIMFVSVTIGVKADSVGELTGNEYVVISPTNPDVIYMGEDINSEGMYVLGGNDIYYYRQGFPNSGNIDAWSVFNPASEETEIIYRAYTIETALQNGRFRVFTSVMNGDNYWHLDTIQWYKEDFMLLKRDVGTCSTTTYGLFPSIRLYDLSNSPTQINYQIEALIYYVQNGELQERTINISDSTNVEEYDHALHWTASDFGINGLNDNTIIYFDYFKLIFGAPTNYVRMQYGYTLISIGGETATDDLYGDISSQFLNSLVGNGGGIGGNILDVGQSMLTSVNSFFQFELLPGFSLFNVLTICLAIPLLIWIIKLIMGG